MDMDLSARKLDKMIEEATVDCYDELEQASGFYTMIEDHLAVPFATQVLGVEVSVVGVEMDDNGSLKAVCERNGKRQLIGLIDLQLPKPPPSGAEWIAAYRRCLRPVGLGVGYGTPDAYDHPPTLRTPPWPHSTEVWPQWPNEECPNRVFLPDGGAQRSDQHDVSFARRANDHSHYRLRTRAHDSSARRSCTR